MSLSIILVIVIALAISAETSLTFYNGTGEESSFNGITKTCLDKYDNREFIKSPPKSLQSFIGCENLNLSPEFLQPMTADDLQNLMNNTQRLLTLIEDFPSTPMTTFRFNARRNLVQMTKMVLHQADTPCAAANESESRHLVHLVLRLKSQFMFRFPNDADVPSWDAFLSKHQADVDAILSDLEPNVQILVDFMNNNHANFTDQPEVMAEFAKLYGNVFNAYFVNEISNELKELDPESWTMLFNVLNKAPKDSDVFHSVSRFNRTTFFTVNSERIAVMTGAYLFNFLRNLKTLLELPKNETEENFNPLLMGIVDRFDVVIQLILRQNDFTESDAYSMYDVNTFCNYVVTQLYMEMTNDERFLNNHAIDIDAIKRRFDGPIDIIKERVFPEADFRTALGVPYDELTIDSFQKFLAVQIVEMNERLTEAIEDDDDDDKITYLAWAIDTVLHYASRMKIEKHLVMDNMLLKAVTQLCSIYLKNSDSNTIQNLSFVMFEGSFKRIYGL